MKKNSKNLKIDKNLNLSKLIKYYDFDKFNTI